jgi:hypothetical protein
VYDSQSAASASGFFVSHVLVNSGKIWEVRPESSMSAARMKCLKRRMGYICFSFGSNAQEIA